MQIKQQLKKINDKVKPFLPQQRSSFFTSKAVEQCPACSVYTGEFVEENVIQNCYQGETEETDKCTPGQDSYCAMTYHWVIDAESDSKSEYCEIDRECCKYLISKTKLKKISSGNPF